MSYAYIGSYHCLLITPVLPVVIRFKCKWLAITCEFFVFLSNFILPLFITGTDTCHIGLLLVFGTNEAHSCLRDLKLSYHFPGALSPEVSLGTPCIYGFNLHPNVIFSKRLFLAKMDSTHSLAHSSYLLQSTYMSNWNYFLIYLCAYCLASLIIMCILGLRDSLP